MDDDLHSKILKPYSDMISSLARKAGWDKLRPNRMISFELAPAPGEDNEALLCETIRISCAAYCASAEEARLLLPGLWLS